MTKEQAVEAVLSCVDPRLRSGVRAELARLRAEGPISPLRASSKWVIAGHRGAGKSSALRPLAALAGRPAFDLDAELERAHGRALRQWVTEDQPGFRAAEREGFARLPQGCVVAVGGGFLSLHGDLLEGHEVILLPLTFETYVERLSRDRSRPRLRPELSLQEELHEVYWSREAAHARVRTHPLPFALWAIWGGAR